MCLLCWDCYWFCLGEGFEENFIGKVLFELGLRGYIKVCEVEDRGRYVGRGSGGSTC